MSSSNLWAPWRKQYIRAIPDDQGIPSGQSFLRDYWQNPEADREQLVIHRSRHSFLLMNRYPYTSGHLLVAPGEHLADLTDLTAEQRADLMEETALGERLVKMVLNPQGINIGMNLGRCAGAGLPGHLHVHIVPRWAGDTNFMSAVGQVRVIPEALETLYDEMLEALPELLEQIQ
jgi:ATP adenylyltransferase